MKGWYKMRLIDADELKRSFNKLCDRFGEDFHISAIETEIDAAQTVDAVEVVRCKDCKHKGWIQEPCHGKSVDFCNVFDSTINNPEKCFCYYGERRKNEAD